MLPGQGFRHQSPMTGGYRVKLIQMLHVRPEFGVKWRKTPTRSGVRPQMAQNFAPFGSDITLGVTPHES